jgi:hypothetical protein
MQDEAVELFTEVPHALPRTRQEVVAGEEKAAAKTAERQQKSA